MKNKKATPYLDFYKKYVGTNEGEFLCYHFGYDDELLTLFKPDQYELAQHVHDGYFTCGWGSKIGDYPQKRFNEFRQTIVLFMAAMNNEL